MIENTDDEQIERLNSRIIELLRERDALVKALEGVLREADRNTVPFIAARAILASIKERA